MGRSTKGNGSLGPQVEMFPSQEMGSKQHDFLFKLDGARIPDGYIPRAPDQTSAKSKLIAEYITKFQLITRGGLFIDGFSAPQSRDHEDAWTARRVLEIEPKRLRAFWLCDLEPRGLMQLRNLKAIHHRAPPTRRVFVMPGDFNETVKTILTNSRMTPRTAIFALLDQRNTECHWSTVKALAARAGRTKIELLYFLGTSWLHRSLLASSRPERLAEIDRWWGSRDWTKLTELSQLSVVQAVASRFSGELGYRYVNAYPIFQDDSGQKVAFHLIHASDHREAPKLMARAYVKIVGDVPSVDSGRQRKLFD